MCISNCLYSFLDGKKLNTSNLPLRDSHDPKTIIFFQISRAEFFFEKILILYFCWPKSWIWQTLKYFMDLLQNANFIMLHKNIFGQKNQFPRRVQKCHFGKIEKLEIRIVDISKLWFLHLIAVQTCQLFGIATTVCKKHWIWQIQQKIEGKWV